MSNIRVYQIVKEFNLTYEETIHLLIRNGYKVRNALSSVEDKAVALIKEQLPPYKLVTSSEIYGELSVEGDNDPNILMKLRSLEIYGFRNFATSTKIEINDALTLIVGQNATSKSTLLGMICQPFEFEAKYKVYTNIYDSIDKAKTRTILGKTFQSKFSDVFRMSLIYDDPRKKKYSYTINLEIGNRPMSLPVISEARSDQKHVNIRFVTGKKSRDKGEGNYPHPIIYLGLNRLYPLANSESIIADDDFHLSDEESSFYSKWQKKICVVQDEISPEFISTDIKDFIACKTAVYDAEANSAGQDNLGQIISAVISFMRLKKKLKENYRGGILLIDEVDATLHLLAQEKLLEFLIYAAEEFSLQIVCTTHSLHMIQLCCHQYKNKSSIISLFRRNNEIRVESDASYEDIYAEINAGSLPKKPPLKVTALFEDSVAATFFKYITHNAYSSLVNIYNSESNNDRTALPANVLLYIASKDIPLFQQRILYVIDGDMADKITKKHKHLLALPLPRALEEVMYDFLKQTHDDDSFWPKGIGQYNKQQCFRKYFENDADDDNFFKSWFAEQKKHWGKENVRLYKRWVQCNKEAVTEFNNKFFSLYNRVSPEKCNQSVLEKILLWIDNL
nr:MAG TPA: AAA ATPase [Caudoviricetes sp.]